MSRRVEEAKEELGWLEWKGEWGPRTPALTDNVNVMKAPEGGGDFRFGALTVVQAKGNGS